MTLKMAQKMSKILLRSSGELYQDFKYGTPAFVLLLGLNEKALHFKFEVNRLKPAGVVAQEPLV